MAGDLAGDEQVGQVGGASIRPAAPDDTPALIALAEATGIFRDGEAEGLLGGVLMNLHGGRLDGGHQAWVCDEPTAGAPAGWVYFSPDESADRIWNLWWIGVAPDCQGRGIGSGLLRSVEAHVKDAGGRILIIESSALPAFEATRRFYTARGYAERGRVPDYYADGDDKVIYSKRMAGPAPAGA